MLCDLHCFLICFKVQFDVMDNYTDHYDVLIELNIGYLENYVTMILWQLN